MTKIRVYVCISFLVMAIAGCGSSGSGGGKTPPSVRYTVGGFVNDLLNSPVTLVNNGTDKVTIPTYGSFAFPTLLSSGTSYNITIGTQPTNGQNCIVQNPTGVVTTANINSIIVFCLSPATIGGTLFGLTGSGLALQLNGADTLSLSSNGAFQFTSTVKYGDSYVVTVSAQPTNPAQRCTLTNNTGSPQGNVENILVTCGSAEAKWTWMGGSQLAGLTGIYGQQGVAAPGNNPGARGIGSSWTDPSGKFWLFGGTIEVAAGSLNDLWSYSSGEWTWVNGSSLGNNPAGVYGILGTPSPMNDPGARSDATTRTDSSGSLWLFGGYGTDANGFAYFNDLWRFSDNQWTWISGSDQSNQPPVYGTLGIAAAANVPGARSGAMTWIDQQDNLWLFGGNDVLVSTQGGSSRNQNDLWKFNGKEWTWVGGPNNPDNAASGIYGTLGKPSPANVPGARTDGSTWTDASGAFWLFGGTGQDSVGTYGYLNDLWRYKDAQWTWMGGSDLANNFGTFGIMGVADPANVPPAREGASSWTDASGNFWLFGGGGKRSGGR